MLPPLPKGWVYRLSQPSCVERTLIAFADTDGEMPIAIVRDEKPFYREIYREAGEALGQLDFLTLQLIGKERPIEGGPRTVWEYSRLELYIVSPNPMFGPGQSPLSRARIMWMDLVDRLREGADFEEHLRYLWRVPELQEGINRAHEWQMRRTIETQSGQKADFILRN